MSNEQEPVAGRDVLRNLRDGLELSARHSGLGDYVEAYLGLRRDVETAIAALSEPAAPLPAEGGEAMRGPQTDREREVWNQAWDAGAALATEAPPARAADPAVPAGAEALREAIVEILVDVLGEDDKAHIRHLWETDINRLATLAAPVASDAPGRVEALLADACKPWEFVTGEPPEWDSPLHQVFVAGMTYTERLLANFLDVKRGEGGDGSEDFDIDATKTLENILTAAGIYDPEEGGIARHAPSKADASYDPTTQPFDEPFRHVDQAAAPIPPVPPEGDAVGINLAIALVEKYSDEHCRECGIYDPSTNATEFRGAAEDVDSVYQTLLEELNALRDARAAARASANTGATMPADPMPTSARAAQTEGGEK